MRDALVATAVAEILRRPDIVRGMEEADLDRNVVADTLEDAARLAQRDLAPQFDRLQQTEEDDARLRVQQASAKRLKLLSNFVIALLSIVLVAVVGLGAVGLVGLVVSGFGGHWHWKLSWFGPTRLGLSVGLLFVLALLSGSITELADKRTAAVSDDRLVELESSRALTREQLWTALVEEWLLPRVTKLINDRIEPSFDTHLTMTRPTGLGSPVTSKFEVRMRARAVIEERLNLWQTGSIGIAGPRGVGKSTLIKAVCSTEAMYGGRPSIPVLASAPVKYEAYDFLLHLYASLCESVLQAYGERADDLQPLDEADSAGPGWARRARRLVRALTKPAVETNSRPKSTEEGAIAIRARRELHEIRFQQTYTAGWSGSVTAPVGGLNLQRGRSASHTPLTPPVIVARFQKLAEALARNYNVIVAIDELDKIATADEAGAFLNDIKGVFEARNCAFLLSVSEEAMSSFERRGLPARDAIDSALDVMVTLEYMRFSETADLINRRVVGLPYPFIALCHVLGGGLPREVLRVARRLAMIASAAVGEGEMDTLLPQIVRRLSDEELHRKTRAAEIASLNLDPAAGYFAREVVKELGSVTIESLSAACRSVDARLTKTSRESPLNAAAQLVADTTAYAYFLLALVDVLGVPRSESELRACIDDASGDLSIEMLARARQTFAVGPHVAWQLVSAFRAAWSYESVAFPGGLQII